MSQENNQSVDWTAFADALEGDTDLMSMLASLFLEHIDEQLERLQLAFDARDAEGIEKAAHGIKGSLAQLFAEEARGLAERIESRGRAKDLEGLESLAQDLASRVGMVCAAVSAKYG